MMESFFCAMEMKLPGAWSPLANTIPALGEVHRNVQHKETWNHLQELAEHSLFLTRLRFHREFHQNTMLLLHTLLCHILQIRINKNIDLTIQHTIGISCLFICPMILYHSIRLQYIGTDLVAPADFGNISTDVRCFFCILFLL